MKLDLDDIRSPYAHLNEHKGNDGRYGRCRVCGKPITSERSIVYVHEHFGGGVLVTEDEVPALNPAADLGGQPIGRDCYRKHRDVLEPFVSDPRRTMS